ncbi:flagellar basal body P-ring formation chaperone FlgA [Enterobacter ludwigii]
MMKRNKLKATIMPTKHRSLVAMASKKHQHIITVCLLTIFILSPSTVLAEKNFPAPSGPAKTSSLTSDSLTQFVSGYWRQRFIQYASRVDWHDYQWSIKVVIPEGVKKLPSCQRPYHVDDTQDNLPVGRQSLRVQCPDIPGWSLTTRSQITVLMPVVTVKMALAQEHVLQTSDLSVTTIQLAAHQADVLTRPEQAVGLRSLRPMRAGQPVRARLLEAVWLVRKGDKVQLTLTDGKMSVSMEGTALQNGQKGEVISIRNEKSGKIISALVSAPGRLEVFSDASSVPPQN